MDQKLIFINIIIVVLLVVLIYNYLGNAKSETKTSDDMINAKIKGKTYSLEVADTAQKRQQGLMYKEVMPQNEGMLFIFPNTSMYPFWMKNTLIPLDIIWLNEDKTVVFIKQNAQPCENTVKAVCNTIFPARPARYVIELNAGEVQKLKLANGDKIEF